MSDGREASVGVRGRVVAVLLTHRGQICLLRRSAAVRSDRGRWHCVTGYLPDGTSATDQALAEVAEETGLARQDVVSFTHGPVLYLADPRGGTWIVHSYLGETRHPNITLNWENDATRWVSPDQLGGLPVVPWLSDVAKAVGWVVSGC